MKKHIKPISVVVTVLITVFFFVVLFPSFKSQAGALGDTYLYLSRIRAGLNGRTTVTGTVGVTNNNTAVTGAATSFNTELAAGDIIKIYDGANMHVHAIASVTNATNLVLATTYRGSTASGLTATVDNNVEMILAFTPSQSFNEADNIVIEILFPMADDAEWCRNAAGLTVSGVTAAPPNVSGGHEITAALPTEALETLTAVCTQGNGTTTVDTITITFVGDLVNTNTYGVKITNNAGILGTSATSGSRTVTVQVSDDNNLDSTAFGVYLIATDIVTVTATVQAAPTINCTINPTSINIGTLFPGGALVTTTSAAQLTTSSTNSGYYWAVYGKGNGTTAGLYNSTGTTYLLPSAATTIDLTGADSKGFGLTVTPPTGATTAANFVAGTPGIFGGIVANASGAKLLLYKATETSPAHSAGITYGARADSASISGVYTEFVTYVCGGYY